MMGFVFGLSPGAGAQTTAEGPRTAIELYFKAHAFGDPADIRQAFAPDASIQFLEEGTRRTWSVDTFAARFQGPAADESGRVRRIEKLDFDDTTASAVVTLDYPDVQFRDRLSLLKLDGQWRIVSKVFSARRMDRAREANRQILEDWSLPFAPRKIIGNIYYVGSNQIGVYLIASDKGHVLIDTGHAAMLPQVEANIRKLGFKISDVKVLLDSHAHFDHCGGFAQLKREFPAIEVVASKADGESMMRGGKGDFYWGDRLAYEPVTPDRVVSDGERVRVGDIVLTALMTPGHTKGCTSWQMRATEGERMYNVLFLCGLTVSPYKLTNNGAYPNIVEDARGSLHRLRSLHVDVLLAAHAFWFDLQGKAARQDQGDRTAFVDSKELDRHLSEMESDLSEALQAQERQR